MNERTATLWGVAIVVLVTFAAIEVAARVVHGPWQPPEVPYTFDPDVGVWVEPGPVTVENVRNLEDGWRTPWFINEHGMQDGPVSLEKPPGVCRIAVLGDSYMDGHQVGRERRLSSVLDQRLGEGWEVLNFALSSVGTIQEMLIYEHKARPFDPDLVVLGAYINDVRNNSREIERSTGYGFLSNAPYFTVGDDGDLTFHPARPPERTWVTVLHDLAGYSYALRAGKFIASRIWSMLVAREAPEADGGRLFGEPWPPSHVGYGVFSPPDHEAWQDAWRITEYAMERLRDSVRADGAELVVLAATAPQQIMTDPASFISDEAGVEAPADLDVDYPNERFCAVADSLGVACLDMLPVLRRYRDTHDMEWPYFWFETDGHWNALAHELAADTLTSMIRSMEVCGRGSGVPASGERTQTDR